MIDRLMGWLIDWCDDDWLIDMIDWSIDVMIDWLMWWLIDWYDDWLIDVVIDWLIDMNDDWNDIQFEDVYYQKHVGRWRWV